MAVEQFSFDLKPPEAPFLYRLGRRVQEWGRLMRLDKPVGIWLLLWPELWALWIAGDGHPEPRILVIFLLGTVVMRSAGCVINDFADRNVDPYVKRTKGRPLAARRIGPWEALALFVVLASVALCLALQLDPRTLRLALVGAVLTVSYPFLKRFFPLPQFYLGLAFGWAVPMAYMAAAGQLQRVTWILFVAAVLWACIYDTLYAMVDRDDDAKIGVKSSAILFADMDKIIVAIMQAMMLFALILAGRAMTFTGNWYLTGVIAAAIFFVYQQWLIRDREPSRCFRAFQNNQYVGLSIFIGVLLQYIYAPPGS